MYHVFLIFGLLFLETVKTTSFRENCNAVTKSVYSNHIGHCFALAPRNNMNRVEAIKSCKIGFDGMVNGRLAFIGFSGVANRLKNMTIGPVWIGLVQREDAIKSNDGWEWVDSRNGG